MSLLHVSFCVHTPVQKVPSRGTRVWVLLVGRSCSRGDDCPLQPSPQAPSSNAVPSVRSFIFLPVVFSVSNLAQMFSVERSNAIFVAEILVQCISVNSVNSL